MKKILSLVAILAIVLLTFSTLSPLIAVGDRGGMYDWPMFHQNAANTSYSESPAPNTNNIEWIFSTGSTVTSSPAVAYGMVYFGDHDGRFYALNASSGEIVWIYDTRNYIYSSPAVADGVVYFGSTSRFYALDAYNGRLIWSFDDGTCLSPKVINGIVYVQLFNLGFVAFNAINGDVLWSNSEVYSWYPAISEGKVIVHKYSSPYEYHTMALNALTGEIIWDQIITGDQPAATITSNKVIVTSHGNYYGIHECRIYAFDLSSGRMIWSVSLPWQYVPCLYTVPSVGYGKIYVPNGIDGKLYAFEEDTGALTWIANIESVGHHLSTPAIADGKVFIGSPNGKVYALNAETGEIVWYYTTGGRVHSSPAVAYGKVYIGSNDGNMYCFGDRTPPPPVDLKVVNVSAHSISLSWGQSLDQDFFRYEIYMSEKPISTSIDLKQSKIVAKVLDRQTTSLVIENLWSSTTYYFVIKVVDLEGLSSLTTLTLQREVNATTFKADVRDDDLYLIIPPKVKYWLYGVHSYKNSIEVYGQLYVTPYNGTVGTGTLTLISPKIVIGSEGAIIADKSGYPGGKGGLGGTLLYPNEGGYGGCGGEGPGGGEPGTKGGDSGGDGQHAGMGGGGGGAGSYGGLGGYGGEGGYKGYGSEPVGKGGAPGLIYGNASAYEILMGSGGGGGGGGAHGGGGAWGAPGGEPGMPGENGEAGGGAVALIGQTVIIDGLVSANGGKGGDGGAGGNAWYGQDRAGGGGGGGGGGASGGTILINATYFILRGSISAVGGPGGRGGLGGFSAAGNFRAWRGKDGEYGGGGRIKLFYSMREITGQILVGNGTVYEFQYPYPVIIATIDINPQSLNLRSKGKWVTAYIELPEGYDVSNINVSSIMLNDTIPVYMSAPTVIGDYDDDAIPDLMVKFDRAKVINYILDNIDDAQLLGEKFMTITLTITGKLKDGTQFQGSDNIKIIMSVPRWLRKIYPI